MSDLILCPTCGALPCDQQDSFKNSHLFDTQRALAMMVDQYGGPHDPGCPEDDTCQCVAVEMINRALEGFQRE